MTEKRIGKKLRPYLQKAKDSAILAVEVYNKPATKFRCSGYITLMVIAWTALLHAIFLRKGVCPYYKHKNGRYQTVDGDFKHWELGECANKFWETDSENPIRKNLEFFIPLRNKIEHRYIPELDAVIFGECQALLLNFDEMIGSHFGPSHQLRESLSFSLQLFPSGISFAQAVKANKSLLDIRSFIDDYRSMLAGKVVASGQYAFKAFLIQVANHDSSDTLPIQFVQHDKLTEEQKEEFQKFAVMVKWKGAQAVNGGLLKPGAVVKAVQHALGNLKVQRVTGPVDKFNSKTHERCWKKYGVRPMAGAKNPAATKHEYCVFDQPHGDYLYTAAWVEFLVSKMGSEDEYQSLFKKAEN